MKISMRQYCWNTSNGCTRILPGAGAGFRYMADSETNMNVGLDFAVGDGDWGLYFRVGEAF